MEHDHGNVALAGCYYVASGAGGGGELRTGLWLADPRRDNATGAGSARRTPFEQLAQGPHGWPEPDAGYRLEGRDWGDGALGRGGTLALWPGHLQHWVPPHDGNAERVSIAFNVGLTRGPAGL
eukprot:COSAG04_NODE_1969_length_5111_cov_5.551676_6_plen_123_part_00